MIHSITARNFLGESIKMTLTRPQESGFIITNVDGLGPPPANINTTTLATTDGALYNSAKVNERNIVLSLIYVEDGITKLIEDTRLKSYKYFPIKKPVTLTIETDRRLAEIVGYVESNEPEIFSEQESTQISIICPDPYFYSVGGAPVVFSGLEELFGFPFSNESLFDDLLEMSSYRTDTTQIINYEGDADVGFVVTIHALGLIEDIQIFNLNTQTKMSINTTKLATIVGDPIQQGDDLIISTVKGNKYVEFLSNGVRYNALNALTKDSDWLYLTKGKNRIAYSATTGLSDMEFSLFSKIAYEGV